ncbi:TRAP transporter small permease [Salinarimonas ramus]|uniref:TRAP transporter small permease protein n=1 Tax=Salinarimonas ramus TaxID=690164 RepID=A0A917QHI1_9HYPH|nr:TRAP transporter small permease [Salinarimonas ramus]GGK50861.1 membrane protein [Salinarimonas ramus]
MRTVLAGVDKLNAVLALVVGALLAVTAGAVLYQVIVRFVLTAAGINVSAPWTEELARYTLIWMVFLGAGVGCRRAQMIALEFLVRRMPARIGVPIRYGTIALSIAFFGLLFWIGLPFVELGRTETSPVMNLEKSVVYWALPVGAMLMILNSIALVVECTLDKRDIRFAADGPAAD